MIEAVEDFHEIHLRCLDTGWYSRWLLTEAQGGTFADVEIGLEPATPAFRAVDATVGKRWHRRLIDQTLAALRDAVARQ